MQKIDEIENPAINPLAARLMGGFGRQRAFNRAENAARFCSIIGLSLWQGIELITNSLEQNRRTVVESGHATGKTITTAALACYWMETFGPEAKVITLAPTFVQVNNILWRYIRSFNDKNQFIGKIYDTPRWDVEPDWHALGLSPRKDSSEALQSLHGFHSPNLLVILDEAPGLPRILWEAVEGLVTATNNKILALGNPIDQSGPFWDACQSPQWNHIRLSCLDHPNVKQHKEVIPGAVSWEWVDGMVKTHCLRVDKEPGAIEWPVKSKVYWRPSAVFETRVLGQAPESSSDALIPLSWLYHAVANDNAIPGRFAVIGLDPARYGGDEAAMVCRVGNQVQWVRRRRPMSANPSAELAGWLKEAMFETQATRAYIDEIGVGAGVLDVARGIGLPAMGVAFSRGANAQGRFANLRAEAYWRVREWLQDGNAKIPDDDLLIGDLAAPKFWYDLQGRIVLEGKAELRKRINRSPDSGDALALTFALPEQTPLSAGQYEALVSREKSTWVVEGASLPVRRLQPWRMRRR